MLIDVLVEISGPVCGVCGGAPPGGEARPYDFEIHHLDGNPGNNAVANLMLVHKAHHPRLGRPPGSIPPLTHTHTHTQTPTLLEPGTKKKYTDHMLEVFLSHAQAIITENGGHTEMDDLWPEAIRRARERDGVTIKPDTAKGYLPFIRVLPGGAA